MPPTSPAWTRFEEIVEDARVAPQGVAEGGALFDVPLDIAKRGLENPIFLLVRENVEALHEREPGVDHGGELPREDDELFRIDARSDLKVRERAALANFDGVKLLLAKPSLDGGLVFGLHHAFA
jgi:hypothetical protein